MTSAPEKNELLERIERIVDPALAHSGFELVDMEYKRERPGLVLRLFVDRSDGGITIDECAQVSREIGDLLDIEDVIPSRYNLEVSSPGLDRPLRKPAHFEKALGGEIKLSTKTAIEGRKRFKGVLLKSDETELTLDMEGKHWVIPHQEVEKARLVYRFE